MSNEQPSEEIKGQHGNAEVAREIPLSDLPETIEVGDAAAIERATAAIRESLAGKQAIHLTLSFESGGFSLTKSVFVSSTREANTDEETKQAFGEVMSIIDRMGEERRATQEEIAQLRIETKELISRLIAA
jgi:hypothetical protein